MLCVDVGGRITLVNAQAERLFGSRREEQEGQFVEMLVPDIARMAHPRRRAEYMTIPMPRPMDAGMGPGTGLGVGRVRLMAERHSGRAWAVGPVGDGATSYFAVGWKEIA